MELQSGNQYAKHVIFYLFFYYNINDKKIYYKGVIPLELQRMGIDAKRIYYIYILKKYLASNFIYYILIFVFKAEEYVKNNDTGN